MNVEFLETAETAGCIGAVKGTAASELIARISKSKAALMKPLENASSIFEQSGYFNYTDSILSLT
jgi:hypothetical protein